MRSAPTVSASSICLKNTVPQIPVKPPSTGSMRCNMLKLMDLLLAKNNAATRGLRHSAQVSMWRLRSCVAPVILSSAVFRTLC